MNVGTQPSQFLPLFLARAGVGDAARRAATAIPARRATFRDGEVIVRGAKRPTESCLLLRGLAVRRHEAPRGGSGVSAICVPGDFMDLHSLLLETLEHDIVSIGGTAAEFIPHETLVSLCDAHRQIRYALWAETLRDASAHRVWTVLAGTMRAPERIAHVICELEYRLALVGLAEAGNFAMPLTQADMAEVTGFTAIHVNRALQELRGAGLLEWQGRTVHLPDVDRLRAFCGFEVSHVARKTAKWFTKES